MTLTNAASIATILGFLIALFALLQGRRKSASFREPKSVVPVVAPTPQRTYPSAERMKQVIELINVGRSRDRLTAAHFAERLKLERPGELEQILESKIEPTFEFLEKFAGLTGANIAWLKFGERQPLLGRME